MGWLTRHQNHHKRMRGQADCSCLHLVFAVCLWFVFLLFFFSFPFFLGVYRFFALSLFDRNWIYLSIGHRAQRQRKCQRTRNLQLSDFVHKRRRRITDWAKGSGCVSFVPAQMLFFTLSLSLCVWCICSALVRSRPYMGPMPGNERASEWANSRHNKRHKHPAERSGFIRWIVGVGTCFAVELVSCEPGKMGKMYERDGTSSAIAVMLSEESVAKWRDDGIGPTDRSETTRSMVVVVVLRVQNETMATLKWPKQRLVAAVAAEAFLVRQSFVD